MDIDYHSLEFVSLKNRIAALKHKEKLANLLAMPFTSGFAAGKDSQVETVAEGVIQLRPTNITTNGEIVLDEAKFVPTEDLQESDYVNNGEVLFNNTNSSALVGKTAYFKLTEKCVCSNHITRIRPNNRIIPEFLVNVFNYLQSVKYFWRLSTNFNNQAGINNDTLNDILVPLPPIGIQRALVAELEAAREARREKLAQADTLLAGLDDYLLTQLGLIKSAENTRLTFGVRLKQLHGNRLDALSHLPYYGKNSSSNVTTKSLSEIANINKHRVIKPSDDEELVPYVGLPECDLTEVREVTMRPYREVKGRNIVKPGDILFARIEPSVFNKKYVFVNDLKGHDYAYTSTEFYVVTANEQVINREYLYAMFFCSFVFAQVVGKTTGSSGRRRIDLSLFSALQIPVPQSYETQENIALELRRRREQVRHLRAEAMMGWTSAKARFEQKLLGGDI